jgi:hypothetical protein
MAYRRPFTPQQRREAIRMYRSCRRHRSLIRESYPPATRELRRQFRRYGLVIREIADQLKRVDARVDVDLLNRAEFEARLITAEYFRILFESR